MTKKEIQLKALKGGLESSKLTQSAIEKHIRALEAEVAEESKPKKPWYFMTDEILDTVIHSDREKAIVDFLDDIIEYHIVEKQADCLIEAEEYIAYFKGRIKNLLNPEYPKSGTPYFFVVSTGDVVIEEFYLGCNAHIARFQSGNFYPTEQEAKWASEAGWHQAPKTT